MFKQALMILAGIIALIGAGFSSYTYLEHSIGPREDVREVVKPATSTQALQNKSTGTDTALPADTNGSLVPKAATTEKTVVTPGPLRVATQPAAPTNSSRLSIQGVIESTNVARAQNGGLAALTENSFLDRDAKMKLDDMFTKQYFEHVSPTGIGPADLAQAAGYAYVIVGENLALGDFNSNQSLVTAWMDSPGHRANILNTHYQEIGVAVGKGVYEGRETWLAVQSFGMPLSSCPVVSAAHKSQIDTNNEEIARLRAGLDAKKAQVDATPQTDSNYNVYASEYNAMIPQYNTLVENNRIAVANYNASVQAFNDCINKSGAN